MLGVALAVLADIGTDVCEEVGAVAGLLDVGAKAGKVAFVSSELLAEEGEVVLLEGRGGKSGFGVEKTA